MDKKLFLEILEKYNRGIASKEEIEFLESYYQLFDVEEDALKNISSFDRQKIKNEISANIFDKLSNSQSKRQPFYRSKWWATAAILAVLSSLTLLYFKKGTSEALVTKTKKEIVVKPGINQAILTLADGSTIGLDEKASGLVVNQAGLKVIKGANGKIIYDVEEDIIPSVNTVVTPRGGQYHMELADGTKVWINAASSIKFPTRFSGKKRIVEITGEIYFEVAKNKAMPFVVRTKKQQIEVLGTHFNVNAYSDEADEKTTLLEGRVKVAKLNEGIADVSSSKVLYPGQVAAIAESNHITVSVADMEAAVAWKNGYFKFDKADIQTVMRQIARWYDIEVNYTGANSEDLFVGKIKRTEDINNVLRILELSKIKTSIKGRTITITN
ncbi:FecR family protein [Pedobacter sp. MW01-1-1]|uniref:FecR family protein n=1 Tax=Pedobacter sp. MW01-1-1 TaxID=3383027 RepID=UPI003FEDBDF6